MRPLFLITLFLSLSLSSYSQPDSTKWLRGFPITSYMVALNDTTKLVQVILNDGTSIPDKQFGLVKGIYNTSEADAVEKGYGRCQLIKGDQYYYFAISHNKSGVDLKEGDLVYTYVDKKPVYDSKVIKLACHFIGLQNVYEDALYDRYKIFSDWTEAKESALIDSVINDIRFTGNYFIQNNPSMDKNITTGKFKGQRVLTVMAQCQPSYVKDFFDYMIARPRVYAGRQWKVSEIFATWVSEGAPSVVK